MTANEKQKEWSAVAIMLLFWGGSVFMGAFGLINQRWGWVILAAGTALIGYTYAANVKSLQGSSECLYDEETYEKWTKLSRDLNTIGNILTVVGVIVIWTQ